MPEVGTIPLEEAHEYPLKTLRDLLNEPYFWASACLAATLGTNRGRSGVSERPLTG